MLGAVLALGGAALLGKLGSNTTIQQVSPLAQGGGLGNVALQAPTTKGLTPERIYRQDAPGVVQITATSVTQTSDPFGQQPSTQTEQSLGSGFVIDKTGHIVTNYHVVQGATKVQVSFSGQDQLTATVVGSDPSTDTAVLKVDAHARAFTPLPLGDSDAVDRRRPGLRDRQPVRLHPHAHQRARQRRPAPDRGAEHARDRSRDPDRRCDQPRQLGRPADRRRRPRDRRHLADLDRNTGGQGNVGIGFAIPINTVRNVAAQIITSGKAEHALLGVSTFPLTTQLAQLFKLPTEQGMLVQTIQKGSGADKAGLKAGKTKVIVGGVSYAIGGDIIVSGRRQPDDDVRAAARRHLAEEARRQDQARDLPRRLEEDCHRDPREGHPVTPVRLDP